jgi:RNA polymerase sigma-70 factor (ECF subfamily)
MRRRLVAFASRYVGDAWEAEDIVQETLLRAKDSLPGLRARDRGEAWLFRICRHAAIDHVRSRHVRRAVWTSWPAPQENGAPYEPGSAPCGGPARASRQGDAHGGAHGGANAGTRSGARSGGESGPVVDLRTLPAHQRLLVSLHYVHGYSQPMLCRMTGLSAAALRVRLFRARLALQASASRTHAAAGRVRADGARASPRAR